MSEARPPTPRQRAGARAEQAALDHLLQHGLRLLARNHHCRQGEVDLILRSGETVVFVEVRYRRRSDFLHPAESVDRRKQRRIIHAARHYLATHPPLAGLNIRFDVIAATGDPARPDLEWYQNAFDAF